VTTCRGIDVSVYQSPQDWAARKAEGVVFAFAKASEGQTSRDPRFDVHIRGIIAAGLVPGAYHFAWPNQDPTREAANYIAAVKPYAKAGFVHWLDLERYSDGRNYAGRTSKQIAEWVLTWLAAVRTAFPGQRVGVYTSADDVANGHLPDGVDWWYPAYPWGAAAYSRAEAATRPKTGGRSPLIWQFTSQPVDRNIAYLSAADFRAWAQGTEEDPMAGMTKQDVHDAVWRIDDIKSGSTETNPGNTTWEPQTYLKGTFENSVKLLTMEAAQTAAITKLASLIGTGVDTATVVAAVQKAIADAVVKVQVDVTGQQS